MGGYHTGHGGLDGTRDCNGTTANPWPDAYKTKSVFFHNVESIAASAFVLNTTSSASNLSSPTNLRSSASSPSVNMHFTAAFAAAILSATTVLAAPQAMGHGLEARMAARRGLTRTSQPIQKNGRTAMVAGVNETTNAPTKTEVEYSSNWAGAVIEEPPSGTFTAVSGKFTVPTPSVPSGSSGSGEYAYVSLLHILASRGLG